ncbi:MAG: hypothetical protein ACK5KO_04565 [Arachnia sp.]
MSIYQSSARRAAGPTIATLAPRVPMWPPAVSLVLCALGLAVATAGDFEASSAAYPIILILVTGLLFYQRRAALWLAHSTGVADLAHRSSLEVTALLGLAVHCLANGAIIAVGAAQILAT